jgi:putative GTP pyrophosphokinase
MPIRFSDKEFEELKKLLPIFDWGLKTMMTKVQIIREGLANFGGSSPIEHFKGRIKTAESIAGKLHRLGHDVTAESAAKNLTDIAGIRIICGYAKDIYSLAEILKSMPDITLIRESDYVNNPKPSGYRSYHLVLKVPVYFSDKQHNVPVEIQMRTGTMDFWATLEHKVRYKYGEHIPKHLSDELTMCAERIAELDHRMYLIHDIISLINGENQA